MIASRQRFLWFAIALLAAVPAGAAWARREAGSFVAQSPATVARSGSTMTMLSGHCLLAGEGTSELFDVETRTWASTGNMNAVRRHHSAINLGDGRVFVAGGDDGTTVHRSTEIYHPAKGVWTPGPSMSSPRTFHTATWFPGDKVVLTGGTTSTSFTTATNTAEVYDPVTNTITSIAPFTVKRSLHQAAYVWGPGGMQLTVLGGRSETGGPLASAEQYAEPTGNWSPTHSMTQARWGFGVATASFWDIADALYAIGGQPDPYSAEDLYWGPAARTNDPHVFPAVATIGARDVFVFGSSVGPKNSAEFYNGYIDRWVRSAYGIAPFSNESSGDGVCPIGTHELLIAPAAGSTVVQQFALSVPVASNDFSGDSRSDIVFVSGPDSTPWVFKMNGGIVEGGAPLPSPAPGWRLAGLGDFDNNGSTDMLWSHPWDYRQRWIHLMQAGTVVGGGAVTTDAWYQYDRGPTHIADFNGDGRHDFLWETEDLLRRIQLMNGVNTIGVLEVTPPAVSGWEIAGAGNFDGLHGADLLWMNYTSPGAYWIQLLDPTANVIDGGPVSVAPGYLPTHIGDANRDGKADILWENGTSSRWVYTMNGAQVLSTFELPPAAPGWVLVGGGDFDNAQGGLDLLWQNTAVPSQYSVTLTDVSGASIGGGGFFVTPGYTPLPTSGTLSLGLPPNPAPQANQPPVITQDPVNRTVAVGASASFSVVASGTPPLAYQWQRNGGNIPGATSATYTLAAAAAGDSGARFRCVVTNAFGSDTSAEATLTVTNVTNTPPIGTITSPTAGALYQAGDTITYAGTGTDAEDALIGSGRRASSGNLPASAFAWRVDFYHDDGTLHVHPFIPATSGATGGSFVIPRTGETSPNVFYRIWLTVTDSGGLTHTSFRDVLPRTSTFTLVTNPPGLSLTLDGQPYPGPVLGVAGMIRSIGTPTPQVVNGVTYVFRSWTDGGGATHNVTTPTTDTTYTATFGPSTRRTR